MRNFRLFSAHFSPIFCRWYPIRRFAHMFTDYPYFCLFPPIFCLFSAYFHLFFTYFLPILWLKWYPILIINSSMLPICHFSAHMFTDSAYFLLIFCSFSTYFPPKILSIFCRSCLAGSLLEEDGLSLRH